MKFFGILLALFILAAGPAQAAGRADDGGHDRLTAELIKVAKVAFPFTVLTIHRVPQQDGSVEYAMRLDTRRVPAAPSPVMQVFLTFAADARTDAVYPAIRAARAEIFRRLEAHRQKLEQPPQLRPDLIVPSQTRRDEANGE